MNFSVGLPIDCQKVLMHPNLHGKNTDWFKNGFSRNKWFRHRLQICVFSWMVVETPGRTSVPNSKLSTPLGQLSLTYAYTRENNS